MTTIAAPAAPPPPAAAPSAPNVQPHRWTLEEYDRAAALGGLVPEMRVELLDGLVVDKMPNNPPHAFPIAWLNEFFAGASAGRWTLRCQLPVRLPAQRSEPEPDLALLRPPASAYRRRHPEPADVLLLVEVADSSLAVDRGEKLALYARAGIPEYWIVNVLARTVEIHREPDSAAGRYGAVREARPGETLAPAAFPDDALPVADLFG